MRDGGRNKGVPGEELRRLHTGILPLCWGGIRSSPSSLNFPNIEMVHRPLPWQQLKYHRDGS